MLALKFIYIYMTEAFSEGAGMYDDDAIGDS